MEVQSKISFEHLLEALTELPESQLKVLLTEIGKKKRKSARKSDLESILLKGPTASVKQIERIRQNRKAINKWKEKL